MSDESARIDCNCEAVLGREFLTSGERQDGERVDCPRCGRDWVHICDEAEGCSWVRASRTEVQTVHPEQATLGEAA